MKKPLRARFQSGNMGIKNKTLFRVSLVVAAMVLLFALVFMLVMNHRTRAQSVAAARNTLRNTAGLLNNYFDDVDSIANEANYDYYLQNYLMNADRIWESGGPASKTKNMLYYRMSTKLFSSYINNRTDVSSVMVFGEDGLLLHKSIYNYLPGGMDAPAPDWYAKARENLQKAVVTGPQQHGFLQGNTEKTISLSRAISNCNDGSVLGVMLIDLNLNEVASLCQSAFANETGSLLVLNGDGGLVYRYDSPGAPRYEPPPGEDFRLPAGEGAVKGQDGVRFQAVSAPCGKPGWTLVALTPMSVVNRLTYSTLAVILTLILLITLMIILVLNSVLSSIVKPIVDLTGHMDAIKSYDDMEPVPVAGGDETARLAASFNGILQRNQQLMRRVVEEQEDKRRFELQALQAQINPHFLYNTLDSIVWMAELKDPNVVPMTEALARLFRISLNRGNEQITLENELEHVRNYLFIQSMRYEDKFTYEIHMEPDVRHCRILKLILQPVVENSIYHGIKPKRGPGHISITAAREGDALRIHVRDDGSGMSGDKCRDILTSERRFKDSSGSGIGVKNVNERIRLYFGEAYGLAYTSVLGRGTDAVITLPLQEEESDEEE